MTTVQRFDLFSAFRVGLAVYGLLGLVAGVLCSALAFAGIHLASHPQLPLAPWSGIVPLIVCPLLYGLIGGIALLVSALLYNIASRWVGGLQVEIR